MQPIAPVTSTQLLAKGPEPLIKLEIYVAPNWVNLNSFGDENFVISASISLGGASMTFRPIEGTWRAEIIDKHSIFHPHHPTSAYTDYIRTERLTRLSIGSSYNGVDYYWQRIIGYMDVPKFRIPDYKISISGGDYMKRLRETEFRKPNNYWGSSATFNSIASDGLIGSEIYNEADAMDITGEANNVANWVATNCSFASFADIGGGSAFVGRLTAVTSYKGSVKNLNVGNATQDKEYQVIFKHRAVGVSGHQGMRFQIRQASGVCTDMLYYPTDDWTEEYFTFTALDTGAIQMWVIVSPGISDLRLDQFSIFEFTPYWQRYYQLPAASKGPYYVTLDGEPAYQGEGDEDWKYEEDAEPGPDPPAHPAKVVFFNINKPVSNGVNNLIIYYFTQQVPENVIADLLVLAGLYADQAAALAAMQYDATGITIDMVWFEAGTTCLDAIKKICERCNYTFYFDYDGIPYFKTKPTAGAADFIFTHPRHITSVSTYQDRNEIKNRIVIEGLKQSDTVGKEETMKSDLKGEDSNAASIATYGERTLTIDNHLFQTQAAIDAMCTALLAEKKDPKWYSDLKIDYKPIPLELGDSIQWEERLSPTLNITKTGIIRDIKLSNFGATYKCELT